MMMSKMPLKLSWNRTSLKMPRELNRKKLLDSPKKKKMRSLETKQKSPNIERSSRKFKPIRRGRRKSPSTLLPTNKLKSREKRKKRFKNTS
jgi:hypothetical protein